MGNPFVYIELGTKDAKGAKEFYGKLLDWEFGEMDMGGGEKYITINSGQEPYGGILKLPDPNIPPMWLVYIGVDDVSAKTEEAKKLGATIIKEKTEVPDMGWFSVIMDPTGAPIAFWEEMKKK